MKKSILIFFCLISIVFVLAKVNVLSVPKALNPIKTETEVEFKEGDLIFQSSQSEQCEAVRIATNSKFSHCGILFKDDAKWYVYEAVQPVKKTLFSEWIKHGLNNQYLVARMKDSTALSKTTLTKMKQYATALFNKNYDIYFEWSDQNMYCSEYIWKIYKNAANIELCNLEKLKSFNLADAKVKAILYQRYGTNIPLNEQVVQVANSDLLKTVYTNY